MTRPLAVLAAAVAVAASGCAGADGRRGSALRGGSVEVAVTAPLRVLDPARAGTPTEIALVRAAYATLYRRKVGPGGRVRLVPALAGALPESRAGGRVLRVRLRDGVRFSDGRPLRAADVARTIARIVRGGGGRARAFAAVRGWQSVASGRAERLAGLVARDKGRVLEIHLARPDATLPWALAEPWSGVVPATTPLAQLARGAPPASGPYRVRFTGAGPRAGAVLVRRRGLRVPGFGPAFLDRIETVTVTRDPISLALRNRVDLASAVPARGRLPILRSTYSDRYRDVQTGAVAYIFLDPRSWPFGDRRVRRAIAAALDYDKLSRLALGFVDASCDLLPAGVLGHRGDAACGAAARADEPRPDDAQRVLADAGVTAARVTVAAAADWRIVPVAREYVRTLRGLGLDARLRVVPAPVLGRRLAGRTPRLQTAVAAARPVVAHPYYLLRELPTVDRATRRALARLRRHGGSEEDWQRLVDRALEEGWLVPLGAVRRPLLLSQRIDTASCLALDPLDGVDLARLCLR